MTANSSRLQPILLLLLAFTIGPREASAQGKEDSTTWKLISKCGLTFSIPSSLEAKEVHEIDSCLGVYETEDLSVSFDYGLYSGVSNLPHYLNLKEEPILIDRRPGQFASYQDTTMDPSCNRVARLFVVTKPPKGVWGVTALNMFVVGRDEKSTSIARKIFASIRIKR